MLVIADGEKGVALAGIMGGLNTEIKDTTKSILLESACFEPRCIRRTAKKLGLSSEASMRFERGVDIEGAIRAAGYPGGSIDPEKSRGRNSPVGLMPIQGP